DRNRSHWSTSKTPSYTKSVSWQHHPIASKVFHAFIDLVNKIRGKKDFMYICTLCCFAEEVKGDYSHYRTFLFDIGNQYKVKLTQSGKKSSL
ncbi:hypothetical protein ACVUR7_15115, partial [Escherichia coli]